MKKIKKMQQKKLQKAIQNIQNDIKDNNTLNQDQGLQPPPLPTQQYQSQEPTFPLNTLTDV